MFGLNPRVSKEPMIEESSPSAESEHVGPKLPTGEHDGLLVSGETRGRAHSSGTDERETGSRQTPSSLPPPPQTPPSTAPNSNDPPPDVRLEPPPSEEPCFVHDESLAVLMCPKCQRAVCMTCWQHPVLQCYDCLERAAPSEFVPVPWEDSQQGWLPRFGLTLASALAPIRTAVSMRTSEIGPALRFFLLTFIPLALLAGIVEWTHTLAFGPEFQLTRIGQATDAAVLVDALTASVVGFVWVAVRSLCYALPFVSISLAFADARLNPKATSPQVRAQNRTRLVSMMLYRLWLLPAAQVAESILMWAAPSDTDEGSFFVVLVAMAKMIPIVLLLISMRTSTRILCGIGPLPSMAAVLLPFILVFGAEQLLATLLEPLRPQPVLPTPASPPSSAPSTPAPAAPSIDARFECEPTRTESLRFSV